MDACSRNVESNQTGLHERLDEVVQRHLAHRFRKPYQEHSLAAFKQLEQQVERAGKPLIFDSCCGVGASTARLAELHPEALVIGMDKSEHRLSRHHAHTPSEGENYLLLRVNLNDLWRLAEEAGWTLSHHYLLYPNPWPKSVHLQRRWHGSAVFPSLLALGGQLQMRSNWPLYLQEFARALELAGHSSSLQQINPERPITPFEEKYQASGQPLWRLDSDLSSLS
ncbi:tRNA (guanine(46)-N(7))-methyltransferase TrmB [Aliagarivorans taiwanensis]|uniref:tRNA (guanine(46)-N(7))-methyltransferase TrmB n=1 Tax=Aliagarivorans taiwanensis TaxID=561966 RepID=UPI0003FD7AB5|nr:SAM-dependent methyltransferase [Aliagarivorans taiwanensis]